MDDDRIWVNQSRKLAGICQALPAADHAFLLVAHFEDTRAALEATLRELSITYTVYSPFDRSALCVAGGAARPVWVALARDIQTVSGAETVADAVPLDVAVVERYPLRSADDAIVRAVEALPCVAHVAFHLSLDDGLMMQFGRQRMATLLQQLGLKEDELLTHPAITTAIRRAQERIGQRVHDEVRTRSAAEWFHYNLPGDQATSRGSPS